MATKNDKTNGPVGLVLAGARGAYEAGALSVLLPALEDRGERPTVLIGTSAGAINAVLLASLAHLPAKQAANQALEVWRTVDRPKVFRPLQWSTLLAGTRYGAELAGLAVRLPGLLDTTPLRHTLADEANCDWPQVHANTDRQMVQAAVVATVCGTGRTAVFVEPPGAPTLPPPDEDRAIDYLPATLGAEHVLASAAIPVAFPPVRIDDPVAGRRWYLDGGVRLNVPLKPALALGVGRVAIIATDPLTRAQSPALPAPPDMYDAAAQLLHAALVDRMIEDVRTLGKTNELLEAGAAPQRLGKRPYRVIPYAFVGPRAPGGLGALAAEVFRSRYGGVPNVPYRLRHPFYPLLSRLLGGSGTNHGELLSYLFFEPEFIEGAIALGQEDARRRLAQGDLWHTRAP